MGVQNCTAAHRRGHAFGFGCDAVVGARRLVAPLQWHTGWTIQSNILRRIWPGASEMFFIDLNFVLILGPLALLFVLRVLAGMCSRCCLSRTPARRGGPKV